MKFSFLNVLILIFALLAAVDIWWALSGRVEPPYTILWLEANFTAYIAYKIVLIVVLLAGVFGFSTSKNSEGSKEQAG